MEFTPSGPVSIEATVALLVFGDSGQSNPPLTMIFIGRRICCRDYTSMGTPFVSINTVIACLAYLDTIKFTVLFLLVSELS